MMRSIFFNDTATTEIYTLSLHDALPISLMERGRTPSLERSQETSRAWVLIDEIRASLQEVEPRTVAGQELYAEGLDQVQRLADARRTRLVAAEEGLPSVLWVVLIAAGIVVVGFAYLFGMENKI